MLSVYGLIIVLAVILLIYLYSVGVFNRFKCDNFCTKGLEGDGKSLYTKTSCGRKSYETDNFNDYYLQRVSAVNNNDYFY